MPGARRIRHLHTHGHYFCAICRELIELKTTKTDEFGNAVHEECYISKTLDVECVVCHGTGRRADGQLCSFCGGLGKIPSPPSSPPATKKPPARSFRT